MGLNERTLQRWREPGGEEDRRKGPKQGPKNKLSESERSEVLMVANSPEFRDLSPKQIVPRLADQGRYIASESTIYRILRSQGQVNHREPSKPARHTPPTEKVATAPGQVWSWDITYLRAMTRGKFYYLYLILDIYSRKIVAWAVHEEENSKLSAGLIDVACKREGISRGQLKLHSDNGGPMKGATMLAMLQDLGVASSFSRPRVSNDNPYSEWLFRTLKYRPEYPRRPFKSLEAAQGWVERFVWWYNEAHLHSGIGYVTPSQRHHGEDERILEHRREVYLRAKEAHPERWTGSERQWLAPREVVLNREGGRREEKPQAREKNVTAREHRCCDVSEGEASNDNPSPSLPFLKVAKAIVLSKERAVYLEGAQPVVAALG